jgi:hypothetical protein
VTVPPFPESDVISEVADWVELTVLNTGNPFRRGRLITTMEREDANLNPADVIDELERRYKLMDGRWPLTLDDPTDAKVVAPRRINDSLRSLYRFFAALGLRLNITPEGRVLFEHCVNEISAAITGRVGIRIGHPREAPVAVSLRSAIEAYCQESSEREGVLKAPDAADQDMGMDVLNWLSFDDDRGGYLHFVGQCATGADWKDKLPELNPHKIGDHINWAVVPVRFFATPVVITHPEFRHASQDGGLILDRPRLMELARHAPISNPLLRRVRAYTEALYN